MEKKNRMKGVGRVQARTVVVWAEKNLGEGKKEGRGHTSNMYFCCVVDFLYPTGWRE